MHSPLKLLGIVLAGGRSSRMGQNKAFLKFGTQALVERAFNLISQLTLASYLSVSDTSDYFNDYDEFPVFKDAGGFSGPAAGIYTALNHAKLNFCQGILIIPCDTPFLSKVLLQKLINNYDSEKVCTFQSQETGYLELTIGLYPTGILTFFEKALCNGENKLRNIIRQESLRPILYEKKDAWHFLNCNTREDWEKIVKIAKDKL